MLYLRCQISYKSCLAPPALRFKGCNQNLVERIKIMGAIIGLFVVCIYLVVIIAIVAGLWKVFEKAGQPGWAAIIPIYNLYVLTQIAGKPWWWLLLCFIPLVNVVIFFLLSMAVAANFGKDVAFAVGLFFLGFIFYPILGFGSAVYKPTSATPPMMS